MKKFLIYIFVILLAATVVSFYLGYFNFGIVTGALLIMLALGAANLYSQKNREYLHGKRHEDYVRRRHKR
ncbi:hypothetical protein [Virgibacillus oceani]|uniref:Uncharacterized protein n=1 Tax=Virgibacillus oceani TaxID=1479511 RepID=A0A917LZF2_9BACI|nr:hypothetical protein [Virgibacillus oceani]GGG66985.1 hypothetical protein GCM10011398_08360 [Virgibacillus oceani]